ncbi:MAG: response regulator [Ferruginibacter sp.]
MKNFKRILVVDDDTDDQALFCDAIEAIIEDIECVMANNGLEGLQKLAFPPPYDVIFLDLNMPIMNGYETLTVLKKDDQYKNIPVIILSTSYSERDIKRCKDLGADKFLTKPSSFQELINGLKPILNTYIT